MNSHAEQWNIFMLILTLLILHFQAFELYICVQQYIDNSEGNSCKVAI